MGYDKDQVAQEFTRWSESYDRSVLQWLLFGPSHRALIRRIREVAGKKSLKMLDVGCGTGVFASKLRTALPWVEICGVDLVSEMLRKGRSRWRRDVAHVMPVRGDSERLPFGAGTFDIVTCANSFHHYPHQQRAVAEMRRVLRPGGRLMIIDGYRDSVWGWFIYDVCVASVEGDVHHASAKRFRELMTQGGLQAVAQRVYHGPAPFLITEAIVAESVPVVPAPPFSFWQPDDSRTPNLMTSGARLRSRKPMTSFIFLYEAERPAPGSRAHRQTLEKSLTGADR